jgi:hypothetical protein
MIYHCHIGGQVCLAGSDAVHLRLGKLGAGALVVSVACAQTDSRPTNHIMSTFSYNRQEAVVYRHDAAGMASTG